MRDENQDTVTSLSRLFLWIAVLVGALTTGASVCQANRPVYAPPGEATDIQIDNALEELFRVLSDQTKILEAQGRSQAEINEQLQDMALIIHNFRCAYLPEETEGCDDIGR